LDENQSKKLTSTQDYYLSYKLNLLNSMKEPNYYEIDKHLKEVLRLKHIVKGRAALPQQLISKSSEHHFN